MKKIRVASSSMHNGFTKVVLFKQKSRKTTISRVISGSKLPKRYLPIEESINVHNLLLNSKLLNFLENSQKF